MMDERLKQKRLDIRLEGTGNMYGGIYKGKDGHITINSKTKLRKRDPDIQVVVGFHAVKRRFHLHMIQPER